MSNVLVLWLGQQPQPLSSVPRNLRLKMGNLFFGEACHWYRTASTTPVKLVQESAEFGPGASAPRTILVLSGDVEMGTTCV